MHPIRFGGTHGKSADTFTQPTRPETIGKGQTTQTQETDRHLAAYRIECGQSRGLFRMERAARRL